MLKKVCEIIDKWLIKEGTYLMSHLILGGFFGTFLIISNQITSHEYFLTKDQMIEQISNTFKIGSATLAWSSIILILVSINDKRKPKYYLLKVIIAFMIGWIMANTI